MILRRSPGLESTTTSLFTTGLFQIVAGATLFAGLVLKQREIILLAALILAMVMISRLWCGLSTRRMGFQTTMSRTRLYPGENARIAIEAQNHKLLPVWIRARVPATIASLPGLPGNESNHGSGREDPGLVASVRRPEDDPGVAGGDGDARSELNEEPPLLEGETGLFAFQHVRWERTVTAAKRGAFVVGPMLLEAGDLLGFFRRREERPVEMEVIVYPRIVPLAPFALPVREFFGIQKAATPVEDPAFHAGTRDYHASRPARHIHWKTSARLDKLQEKLYEPTSQARVLFLLDAASFYVATSSVDGSEAGTDTAYGTGDAQFELRSALAAADSFERTLEVVASLAVQLERARVPVGSVTNGRMRGGSSPVLVPHHGPYQVAGLLEMLARVTSRPDPAVAGFTGEILRVSGNTTCLYVCRSLTGPGARALQAQLYRRRVALIVLVAETPPEEGRSHNAGRPTETSSPADTGALRIVRLDLLRAGKE